VLALIALRRRKVDWKIHKSMCPILKKLSTKLQPFHEVIRIKDVILISELRRRDPRVVEHVEHQFGENLMKYIIVRGGVRERISNWELDVVILTDTYNSFGNFYLQNKSPSMMSSYESSFRYLKRSLNLLKLDLETLLIELIELIVVMIVV
jgi:hypothetical protein